MLGIHTYYRIATHINKDFRKIGLSVNRTMSRLSKRLKKEGLPLPDYIKERYGKSRQLRYIRGSPIIPITYIQTSMPKHRLRNANIYSPDGRTGVHDNLETVNLRTLRYLMTNPVRNESIEFNDNRLALYCAQRGKCAVSKKVMEIGDIFCHHKVPRALNGTDNYGNLVLLNGIIHKLVHAVKLETIARLLAETKLEPSQIQKLNTLRMKTGLDKI